MTTDANCALCGLPTGLGAAIRLQVEDPSRQVDMLVHRSCVAALLAAEQASLPSNLGRIPPHAACGVCGRRLSIIGRHPYALTLHDAVPGRTWFVHAECFPESLRARLPAPQHH